MSIQGLGQSFAAYQPMTVRGSQSAGSSAFNPPSVETVMETDDANQDGVLTIDETPMSEKMFADADSDSNGELSSDELEEVFSNGPPPMRGSGPGGMGGPGGTGQSELDALLEAEDTDSDGSISAEETSLNQKLFSTLDLDEDGLLSQDEIQKGMDEHEARMENIQGGGPDLTQNLAAQAYESAMKSVMTGFTEKFNDSLITGFLNAVG